MAEEMGSRSTRQQVTLYWRPGSEECACSVCACSVCACSVCACAVCLRMLCLSALFPQCWTPVNGTVLPTFKASLSTSINLIYIFSLTQGILLPLIVNFIKLTINIQYCPQANSKDGSLVALSVNDQYSHRDAEEPDWLTQYFRGTKVEGMMLNEFMIYYKVTVARQYVLVKDQTNRIN